MKVSIYNFKEKISEISFKYKGTKTGNMDISGGVDLFENTEIENITFDIYEEDTIKNFKEKIYLATGIKPCEQFLYYDTERVGFEVYLAEEPQPVKLTSTEEINGIPIFKHIFNLRNTLKIIDLEHIQIEPRDYNLLSLASIRENIKDDIELIYWSLIQFFPYFSLDAFKKYIAGEYSEYPILYPEKNILHKYMKEECAIYDNIYEFFTGLSEPQKKKYNTDLLQGKNNTKSDLSFHISEITILIQKRGIPDLENIFVLFPTSEKIPIIVYNDRTITYSKVYHKYEHILNKRLNVFRNRNRALLFICEDNIFEINIEGYIYIILFSHPTKNLDFATAEKIVETQSKIFFDILDELPINFFKKDEYIYFYEIIRMSAGLKYLANLDIEQYEEFIDIIKQKNLVEYNDTNSRFIWYKGIQVYFSENWNEFNYYVEPMERQPSNYFLIENNYSEIIFDIFNVSETEFKNLYKYLIYNLSTIKKSETKNKVDKNLKLLRAIDPKNYNIGKLHNKKIYARYCQKPKQPIPLQYHTGPVDKKRVLSFWNYTREEPMEYYCPNDAFPIPGVSVGYHPENNCLICCRKKETYTKNYSKIYEECMATHKFTDKKEIGSVRYVINFGKNVENTRIGALPDVLNKFLVYNMEDINIISESLSMRVFRYAGLVYSIDRLFKITANTKTQNMPVDIFEEFLHIPVWKQKRRGKDLIKPIDVIENPDKNIKYKKKYKKIMKADLSLPIFVYFNKEAGKYIVVDGVHRLARAFIEKKKDIIVKFITKKQIDRCYIGKYDINDNSFLSDALEITGGDDKEPFYYIMGMPYDVESSFLTSTAMALDKPLRECIDEILDFLDKSDYVNGYESKELYYKIKSHFIEKNSVEQLIWDEIFYNILPVIFDYTPIIFDYISPTNVNLLSYYNLTEDDYIIYLLTDNKYYPIFIIIPYAYSKNHIVEKRIYDSKDQIVKIIFQLLSKKNQQFIFTLEKITDVLEEFNFKIARIIDYGGYAFAVELSRAGKLIYLNFEKDKIKSINYNKFKFNKYDFDLTIEFLQKYSIKYNIAYTIDKFYYIGSEIVAYRIDNFVNFINVDINRLKHLNLQLIDEKYKLEQWNYSYETIFNAINTKEDPILSEYLNYIDKRNDYTFYKEEFFRKHIFKTREELIKDIKKKGGPYMDAFLEEVYNPVKFKLMQAGIYTFQRLYMQKHKNENIYIKIKN